MGEPEGELRGHVHAVLRAALAGADAREAVRRALRLEDGALYAAGEEVPLPDGPRVRVVAAGKGAARMAQGALEALGDRIGGGVVTVPTGQGVDLPGLDGWEASHPLPDAGGLAAAAESLRLVRGAGEGDLVLCLLSGGASALWPAPPPGVALDDLRRATDALLRGGVPIAELNAVRKHLSRIAGGRLARAATPARVVTLAVSDVVGSAAEVIASGPTTPDPTTYADALGVLGRYGVEVPPAVRRHLQAGAAGDVPETPKPAEPGACSSFHVVAGPRDALDAAAREAERLGYRARIVSDRLEGEARAAAPGIAREALRARDAGDGPAALLWAGETTVTVRGAGRGGRNQELALAAALALDGQPGVVVACLGTDGVDGPTDAAGGVADGGTAGRGRGADLDPAVALERNDSHTFLKAAGDLLVTGPTGTNVGDVVVALVS